MTTKKCILTNVNCKMKEKKLDSGSEAGMTRLEAEGWGLGKQIRQWAADNDWYKVDVTTNQLRLEQTFGHAIESVTKDLDRRNQSKMRRQVFDCFDLLAAKCRQIDMVCRTGCRSEAEMLELEFLRGKAVGAAAELSEVLELLKAKSVFTTFRRDTSETNPKNLKSTDQNGNPADCFISFAQAAEILGVSKPTLTRWADDGKIQCNGKKGRLRKLNKVGVLLAKQTIEDDAVKKDVRELRQDARKLM